MPSPTGRIHLGLGRLKREYGFDEHDVKKGRLYLAKSIDEKAVRCFL